MFANGGGMNQHKRKMQNKYKRKILLAAAVASFSVAGITGAQANVPKPANKGAGQARTKSATDMDGNSATSAVLTRKDATSYMPEQAGVRVTQPSWDLLASGYIKDLPSVRLGTPDGASPAEVTVPARDLLASGYIKDLPNVRYQTVVAKDTDSSTS